MFLLSSFDRFSRLSSDQPLQHRGQALQRVFERRARERRLGSIGAVKNLPAWQLEPRIGRNRVHRLETTADACVPHQVIGNLHRGGKVPMTRRLIRRVVILHGKDDFLGQLTVQWENATQPVEDLGIRRVIARTAVVLAGKGGLFPLMALPVRLYVGGKFGSGSQAMPWIHLADAVRAMRFLLEHEETNGAYNLIAPTPASNEEFMGAMARALHRPFWFHLPKPVLRFVLRDMHVLLTEGRYSQPKRLLEQGFDFQYPDIEGALENLFAK